MFTIRGSIRENIAMNQPEADTESIIRVAKAAEAHNFIMELPDGYNTHLGERGAGLSRAKKTKNSDCSNAAAKPELTGIG